MKTIYTCFCCVLILLVSMSCSKTDDGGAKTEPGDKRKVISENQEADVASIKESAQKLHDPDLEKQREGVLELRAKRTPEACALLVIHLQEKVGQLPPKLSDLNSRQLEMTTGYLGMLIEQIRTMDQPEGNKAVADFMQIFRMKYGDDINGQEEIKRFESILKSARKDVENGIYKHPPASEEVIKMVQ